MKADILRTFITFGIKTKIKMSDRLIEFLPEENQEKAKSIRLAFMQATHAAMGEVLNCEQQASKTENPRPIKISID